MREEAAMCFVHSGSGGPVRDEVGEEAATAFSSVAVGGPLGAWKWSAPAPGPGRRPEGAQVLDGFSRVLHNRLTLPAASSRERELREEDRHERLPTWL